MPKFLIQGSFSAECLLELANEKASGQQTRVMEALAAVGGKLEGLYYAVGVTDVYILCECPDYVSASALSLVVFTIGLVRTKTICLLKAEEADQALLWITIQEKSHQFVEGTDS